MILLVWGTRPEAVKLAPLLPHLPKDQLTIWHTGQHPTLATTTADTTTLKRLIRRSTTLHLPPAPDPWAFGEAVAHYLHRHIPPSIRAVIVQGDTASAWGAAIGAHALRIPVHHVEAGVRSHNPTDPYPEEAMRVGIDAIASHHYAATGTNATNLTKEGITSAILTGNPGLDHLPVNPQPPNNHILLTLHRRESWPALPQLAQTLDQNLYPLHILWPTHPNPLIQNATSSLKYIRTSPPLPHSQFLHTLASAHSLITDSGGAQEEAAHLGVPTLTLRHHTDRPEPITAGIARLAPPDPSTLLTSLNYHLNNPLPRRPTKLFSDGFAAPRIATAILNSLR